MMWLESLIIRKEWLLLSDQFVYKSEWRDKLLEQRPSNVMLWSFSGITTQHNTIISSIGTMRTNSSLLFCAFLCSEQAMILILVNFFMSVALHWNSMFKFCSKLRIRVQLTENLLIDSKPRTLRLSDGELSWTDAELKPHQLWAPMVASIFFSLVFSSVLMIALTIVTLYWYSRL